MRINRLVGVLVIAATTACGAADPQDPALPLPQPVVVEATPAILGDAWLKGETVGAEPVMFAVLAGDWAVREEAGERFLRVDGTNWKVGTPPRVLSEKAATLFPASAATFEKRVLAGLQFPSGVVRQAGTFGDGELQVDFRLIGGASDQFASLLFGLTEDGNHYAFRYNTKDGDTALWKVVNGQRERLHHGGVPVAVKLGEWRTLRLNVEGSQVSGWVNDVQALTFDLPAAVSGRVGLWSKADSVTDYRRFALK
ncbi:MAG: hypothetical protein EXQ49_10885 [Acidobacteria bacterium]|nr:hypothetical protein [Acidobacteriota bacterium]